MGKHSSVRHLLSDPGPIGIRAPPSSPTGDSCKKPQEADVEGLSSLEVLNVIQGSMLALKMWTAKGIPDLMLYAVTTTELYEACEGIAHVTLRERAKSINPDMFHSCTATQGIQTGTTNPFTNGDCRIGNLAASKKCIGFVWRVAPEVGYTSEVGPRSVFPLTVASAWHAARHCHPHTITTTHMGIGPENVLRSLGRGEAVR
ncbi:uncharacterized protein EV422DRAFT_301731 [Fimicolochytrium jonesii]|uniref:uncharacterized protein n=1 Tax=Fimicolochytrium jonesii TaxID=1396493 RepID=UPI0022FF1B54|nr:uncharacterized protein EV422DRAFT_301731 [Fimicolochytrium jonesii]KAI8823973.1 hypothetical protein EV422DRAFT_301731 [Fimicolochytrium jonesii]